MQFFWTGLFTYCLYDKFIFSVGNNMKKRVYGTSSVITVFANTGLKMCEINCMKYFDCTAVIFKRKDLYCELLKITPSSQFIDSEKFIFSEKTNFNSSTNDCSPNPCSTRQKCIETRNKNNICILIREQFTDFEMNLISSNRVLHNVALGKPAYTSPDVPNRSGRFANLTNDGDRSTYSHTSEFNPKLHDEIYWMVDLTDTYFVLKVDLINRGDGVGYRLHDVEVLLGLTHEPDILCGHFVGPGTDRQHINITCPTLLIGRFIKLSMKQPVSDSFMHIAEVEVYAYV